MLRMVLEILRIRHGEILITSLLCLYIAGVMGFYYILKPIRSALFLRDLPARDLPNAYLAAALLAGLLVVLMFKLSRRLSVIALVTATNLGVIGSLLFFRWAVSAEFRYLPYAYFSYVQIVSVLCIAQFWLLAGLIFDGRQAKRIYGLLGAGAIIGSIAGSLATDLMRNRSISSMLGICIGVCLGLAVLAHIIWRYRRQDLGTVKESPGGPDFSDRTAGMARSVFGSRHVRLIVLLILLTMIASQIADWQVDYAAQENFRHLPKHLMEQEIKSFRARFNWITNLIAIGLQLSLTNVVLQRAGIGAALLLLPVALGIGSLGVLFAPSLISATVALGSSSVFRYSINRAGTELLFLPLSPSMLRKAKLFIDVFVDRAGRAVAAFIILALTTRYLPVGLAGTAGVVVVLSGACILVGIRLRKSYTDAFRQHFIRREVDLSDISRYVTDPASLRLLISALESTNERQILYSLGLLQFSRGADFSGQLLPLLQHPSPLVREETLHTMHALPGNHEADAERLLADESERVRDAAVTYLCLHNPNRTAERLQRLLGDPNPDVRLAAARCAANQPEPVFQPSMDLIRSLIALDGIDPIRAHCVAALVAVRLPDAEAVPFLRRLIQDSRKQIASAAISAAGQGGYLELAPDIVPLLSDRKLRATSRQALVSMGPSVVANLAAVLNDESRGFAVRCEIPWILSQIQDSCATTSLLQNLHAADFRLRYQIVKALSRVHARSPHLPGNEMVVEAHLIAQISAYYEGLATLVALQRREKKPGKDDLADRALSERLDRQLEVVFRLLGLLYPQKDIYFAYAALKGPSQAKRASAIEFLDNTLRKDIKTLVLPLLEEEVPERLLAHARRLFNTQVSGHKDALVVLLQQPDPWLKTCSLHAIGSDRIPELEPSCRKLLKDPDPSVREMALWALNRISSKVEDSILYADKSGESPFAPEC